MSDLMEIALRLGLAENAVSDLKNQLRNISKDIEPIEIDGNFDKVQVYADAANNIKKVVTDTTTKYGEQLQVVKQINDATNQLEVVGQKTTVSNKEKQKLLDDWLKAQQQHMTAIQNEAIAENKKYDNAIAKEKQLQDVQEQRQSKELWGESKELLDSIGKTPDGVKQLNQYYADLEKSINKAHAEALKMNQEFDKQQALTKSVIGSFEQLKGEQVEASDVAKVLSKEYGDLEVKNYSLTDANGKYAVTLKKSANENLVLKGAIDKTTGSLSVQSETVKTATKDQLTLWDQFKIAFERVPVWLSATDVWFKSIQFVKGTISDITEINKNMIELEKVSSATTDELNRFMESTPEVAKKLGVLNSEVISTTADIVKLGYSLPDAEYLTNLSLIGKTVGDLDNVSDSVDYLTSVLKGFNIQTDDAGKVLDYLNYVADTTSLDFSDLGEGFKRMSAAMSEGNNDLKESAGLLVAGYDAVRNAETVSTALKTTSMRLRGVDEEGNKLTGFIPKLESKFNSLGLTLKEDNTTFKSTFEILKDVSTVWPQLTDAQRASLLEDISGKRNAQAIAAIIQNMSTAVKVAGSFEDSESSALIEHRKYMQGVEASYNKLKATMDELHMQLLKSSTVVKTLNFANTFVENAAALGKMSVAVVGVTAVLGIMLSAQRKAIAAQVELQTVQNIGGFKNLGKDIVSAAQYLLGFKAVTDTTKISVVGLNIAMTALLVGIPLIAEGIGALINHQKRLQEQMEKMAENLQEQAQLSKNADELIKSYEELGNKASRTAEEEEELLSVKEKLNEILPESKKYIDNENLSLQEQVDILKDLNKEQLNKALSQAYEAVDKYGGNYDEWNGQVKNAEKEVDKLNAIILKLESKKNSPSGNFDFIDAQQLASAKEQLESYQKVINKFSPRLKAVENARRIMAKAQSEETVQTSLNILATSKDEKMKEVATNTLLSYGYTQNMITEDVKELTNSLNENSSGLDNNSNSAANASNTFSLLSADVDTTIQQYDLFNQALLELQTEGHLSQKTLEALLDIFPDLIESTGLEKNALIQLITQQKNVRIATIDSEIAQTKATIEGCQKRLEAYTVEINGISEVAKARQLLANNRPVNTGAQTLDTALKAELTQQYSNARTTINHVNGIVSEIEQSKKKLAELNLMKSWLGDSDTEYAGKLEKANKTSKAKTSATKTPKAEKEEYAAKADIYEKINIELEKNNALLEKNSDLQNINENDISKKISLMKEEINLDKQRQNLLHTLNTQQRNRAVQLEGQLKKSGFKFSGVGDNRMITNLNNVNGKTKEVEESFNEYIELQKTKIPSTANDWWELQNAIQDTNNEIAKSTVNKALETSEKHISAYTKSIEIIDHQISLLQENDFKQSTELTDKKIKLTKESIDVVDTEVQKLMDLKKQYSGNKEIIDQLDDKLSELSSQQRTYIENLSSLYKEQKSTLIDSIQTVEDKVIDILKQMYETEKDEALKALEKKKKTYSDDLEAYKDYINEKLKLLDNEYNEDDYKRKLKEQKDELLKLQKELDSLRLDDSDQSKLKQKELREKITEQEKTIADTQREHERDARKQSLQDELDDAEKASDKKVDNIDDEVDRINKEYDENVKDYNLHIKAKQAITNGYFTDVNGKIVDLKTAYEDFEDKFGSGMSLLGDSIKTDFIAQLDNATLALQRLQSVNNSISGFNNTDYSNTNSSKYEQSQIDKNRIGVLQNLYMEYVHNNPDKVVQEQKEGGYLWDLHQEAEELRKKWGWTYEKLGSYKNGGLITENQLAMLHGSEANWEAVLNKDQLKELVSRTVTSSVGELYKNKSSYITKNETYNSKGDTKIYIDKLMEVGKIEGNELEIRKMSQAVLDEFYKSLKMKGVRI